jgi:hypothetical protein
MFRRGDSERLPMSTALRCHEKDKEREGSNLGWTKEFLSKVFPALNSAITGRIPVSKSKPRQKPHSHACAESVRSATCSSLSSLIRILSTSRGAVR